MIYTYYPFVGDFRSTRKNVANSGVIFNEIKTRRFMGLLKCKRSATSSCEYNQNDLGVYLAAFLDIEKSNLVQHSHGVTINYLNLRM